MKSLEHPIERRDSDDVRGPFDRAAQRASYFASSPLFFMFCTLLVLAWIGGYVIDAGSQFETGLGTAMTAVTLLLVALVKNAELRGEHAIQQKLDALATAMLEDLQDEPSQAEPLLHRAIELEDQL